MNEVRNSEQKEQKHLCFEICYGCQKLHLYFRSLLTEDTPLLTCSYIGELRNGRKFKCENKPFIFIFKKMDKVGIPTPFSDKSGGW